MYWRWWWWHMVIAGKVLLFLLMLSCGRNSNSRCRSELSSCNDSTLMQFYELIKYCVSVMNVFGDTIWILRILGSYVLGLICIFPYVVTHCLPAAVGPYWTPNFQNWYVLTRSTVFLITLCPSKTHSVNIFQKSLKKLKEHKINMQNLE